MQWLVYKDYLGESLSIILNISCFWMEKNECQLNQEIFWEKKKIVPSFVSVDFWPH